MTHAFQAGGMAFSIENGCLVITAYDTYSLTAQTTHQLLNLLYVHRRDIYDANTEAKQFSIGVKGRPKKHAASVY